MKRSIQYPLNNGLYTIIDEEDLERVKRWNWYIDLSVRGNVNGKLVLLHRYLLGLKQGDPSVDHTNGDPRDNRKDNLRSANARQQQLNTKLRCTNTSGYRNVSWHPRMRKWQAAVCINYKYYHLGYFNDPKKAAERVKEFKALHVDNKYNRKQIKVLTVLQRLSVSPQKKGNKNEGKSKSGGYN